MTVRPSARLRLTGAATQDHTVPADLLVRAVDSLQQTVWLLAAAHEERQVQKRFTPSADFRKRFTLRCAVPEANCYALPLGLRDDRHQLIPEAYRYDILDEVHELWTAVEQRSFQKLQTIIPDSAYRSRVLQHLKKAVPKRGEAWGVAFSAGNRDEVALDSKARVALDQWLTGNEERRENTSVIGQLLRIDFAEYKVVILYPPTRREIECIYLPEVEETILDAPRGMFQITGRFILDEENYPKRLIEVSEIEPIDLSELIFDSFAYDGTEFQIHPPLALAVTLDDEEQQHFLAEDREFGLTVHGRTRDELGDAVLEQLTFLWREYVEADAEELADDALAIRATLAKSLTTFC